MRSHSRIVRALMILATATVAQCQASPPFAFRSPGQPPIRLGERFDEILPRLRSAEVIVLSETTDSERGWRSIKVRYKGLEIVYNAESGLIYHLRSNTPDWRIDERYVVGAVLNVQELPRAPVPVDGVKDAFVKPFYSTDDGYLLPYYLRVDGTPWAAYCEIRVADAMVVEELSLLLSAD